MSGAYATDTLPRIFVTTIPKTGTTMLSKLIRLMTGHTPQGSSSVLTQKDVDLPEETFLLSHAPALEDNLNLIRQNNLKTLVLLRDPRDVIVSMYYYFGANDAETLGLDYEKDKDKITLLHITKWYLTGDAASKPDMYIKGDYEQFLTWNQLSDVYFTRYEKLVGSKGGGNDRCSKARDSRNCSVSWRRINRRASGASGKQALWGNLNF